MLVADRMWPSDPAGMLAVILGIAGSTQMVTPLVGRWLVFGIGLLCLITHIV